MKVSIVLIVFTALAIPVLGQGQTDPQPKPGTPGSLTVGILTDRVVVADATEGGRVVLFSIARVPRAYTSRIERRSELLADDDGDGRVELVLDDGVARKSIWAAVDLGSGSFGLATPEGYPLRAMHPKANALRAQAAGRWLHELSYLEMLVVRPEVGAWTLTAGDGAVHDAGDTDGVQDGEVETALTDMDPIGASPAPPAEFRRDDVVVVMDPRKMAAYAVEVVR